MNTLGRLMFSRRSAVAAILIGSVLLCLYHMLFSPLEYDEIWSLENFSRLDAGRILTDLALPNNHPLNSLFVKLWAGIVDQPQLIRLHSLLFGVGSTILAGVLARGFYHNRNAAVWTMFCMGLSAPVIAYSQLARGYGMQLCFLLLFACGVVWSGKLRRFLPWRYLPEAAIVLGAVGATLAVPDAPIFLAAIGITVAAFDRGRPDRTAIIALGTAAVAVVAYLLFNYQALRTAQNWGRELGSFSDWELFIGRTLSAFVPYASLPFIVSSGTFDKRRSMQLYLCAGLIIASAAVFKAGPERVYLPLAALVALCWGRGIQLVLFRMKLRRGPLFVSAVMALCIALGYYGYDQLKPRWEVTDYWGWFNAAKLAPETTLTVYPAAEGYPLNWNNQPESYQDHYRRLSCSAPGGRDLLIFASDRTMNGIDGNGSETEIKLPFSGASATIGGREARCYKLRRISAPEPGEPTLLVLPPVPEENVQYMMRTIIDRKMAFLNMNAFFNIPLETERGRLRGRLVFLVAPAERIDWGFARAAGAEIFAFEQYRVMLGR